MSPLTFQILLHYYYAGYDWDFKTDTHVSSRNFLIREGLIEKDSAAIPPKEFRITEKGGFFIDTALNLPMPVMKWEMPS